jgi:hypothetical protein
VAAAAADRQRHGQGAGAGDNATYVSRVLRLTLLAPDIVEAILMGGSQRGCSWMICSRGFRRSGISNILFYGLCQHLICFERTL